MIRVKEHKDLSTISFLLQNNVEEEYFQVKKDGEWINVNGTQNGWFLFNVFLII